MTIENIEKERMIKVMTKKALDLAIKALEQQPCEDCISREAVNTLIDELARAISDERCFVSKGVVPRGRETSLIMQDILALPSVTLKTDVLDKIKTEIKTMSGDIETIADVLKIIKKYEEPNIKLTNSEWIDFLSEQFDISRTSAKEMLHTMMLVKREDNFKKQFSGRK